MSPAFISMTSEGPIMMQNQFSNARMIPQTYAKKEGRTEIYNEILKRTISLPFLANVFENLNKL